MTAPPRQALGESIALCESAADYALEALSAVTDADLDRPTPCTAWNLRRLVLHVADSADGLTDLLATGALSLPAPRVDDPDPVSVARDRVERFLRAVRSGGEQNWASAAAHAGAIEFTAHGWDIATAGGADREIPAELAAEVLELATSLIDDQARQPQFGPSVDIPPKASPSDRFVAFLGRNPTLPS